MPLEPWYKVLTPREYLREGKPLDASEFAVRLDQVPDGRDSSVGDWRRRPVRPVSRHTEEYAELTARRRGGRDWASNSLGNQ
jgi:hypothetical protein